MKFNATRATITAYFKANFTKPATPPAEGLVAFLPTAWPNLPFAQPKTTWCRFTVVNGERVAASIGRTHKRTFGLVYLQVFLAEETGTKLAYEAIDKMAELLDDRQLFLPNEGGDVTFRSVKADEIGKTAEGWYQINGVCEWSHDYTAPTVPDVFVVGIEGGDIAGLEGGDIEGLEPQVIP